MKKIFLLLSVVFSLSVSAQTYEELTDRAIKAVEQDSLLQAEQYIVQALQLEPAHPGNALLFSNLGTVQRRLRKYHQALDSYTLSLNFAPGNVPVLLNRASLYMELGKGELARIDYSMALDVDGENQEALLMRAYIYMRQRNYPFARADYERLLQVAPRHYEGRLGLVVLNQTEGKFEAALTLLNAMIAEGGGEDSSLTREQNVELLVARAGVEMEMKQVEAALMDVGEAIRMDSKQAEAYLMRGQIYLSQGKKNLAKRDFEQAASLGIPSSELRELLRQCR